jgi:hypothetical protein
MSLKRAPSWRRFPFGRGVALLAVSGLLGLGVIAGTAASASASTFTVTLTASPTTLPVGQATTLTATANMDVGPTPYFIEIYNTSAGGPPICVIGTGTTCTTKQAEFIPTSEDYVAYVALDSPASPPSQIQAKSAISLVTWNTSGLQLSLTGPAKVPLFNMEGTYTATTNTSINGKGDTIFIADQTSGNLLKECTTSPCILTFQPSLSGDYLWSWVTGNDHAASNVLFTFSG